MVSSPVKKDFQKFNSLPKSFKSFSHSRMENSSSNSKLVPETGGMASIRQSLSLKEISEKAIDLTSNAR